MMSLLSIQDASEFLGISRHTLRQWVFKRRITFIRVGKRILFSPEDLQQFVDKNRVKAQFEKS